MFTIVSGKIFEYQAQKSRSTATYTYLNFAIDLGLLGKIGKSNSHNTSWFQIYFNAATSQKHRND